MPIPTMKKDGDKFIPVEKQTDISQHPFTIQEGGSHYKDFVIQPAEFITLNGIGFLEGCVIKRMARWRKKDGLQDLRKAKHEIDLLIALEEKKNG